MEQRYVHLLPRLATVGDLTAVFSRAHQCDLEHEDSNPRSISAMRHILKALKANLARPRDANADERHLIEEELAREFERMSRLGYSLFGIVKVVPRFFDEQVTLVSMATIYICHSRSAKIVKANDIPVLPAILPGEATFIGIPVLGSRECELPSSAEEAKWVPAVY